MEHVKENAMVGSRFETFGPPTFWPCFFVLLKLIPRKLGCIFLQTILKFFKF